MYTNRQRVLLSLVARRTDLLSKELLNDAAVQIAESVEQVDEIYEFLQQFLVTTKEDQAHRLSFEYYALTVIIDELVDYIYWEMALPQQELTRISSMAILFKLYDKYSAQYRDGYIRVKVDKGLVLSNPGELTDRSQISHHIYNLFLFYRK